MRILYRTFAAVVVLLISLDVIAKAQPVLPPPLQLSPLKYSSPYGPRNKPSTQQYQFHKGVDYSTGGNEHIPILAVQGSTIVDFDFDGVDKGGWYLTVAGGAGDAYPSVRFSYLHIFDNTFWSNGAYPPGPDGNPLLATTFDSSSNRIITLELIQSTSGSTLGYPVCFVEIFWMNYNLNYPQKALSRCPGVPVGDPTFNIMTTNTVAAGEEIAVVGASGVAEVAGAHLHLQVPPNKESPLRYVTHDNSAFPGYTVSVLSDQGTTASALDQNARTLTDGKLLNPNGFTSGFILRTEVDYSNAGHDLDQVQIVMAKKAVAVTPTCTSSSSTDVPTRVCFNYGGTGQGRTPNVLFGYESLTAALTAGLYPQPKMGGVVDFLAPPLNLTGLDPGAYLVYVAAVDVVGDMLQNPPINVTVPPQLTVTIIGNGTISFSPSGINGLTSCSSTLPCSDWFDISQGVQLTAVPQTGSQFQRWGGTCAAWGTTRTIPVFTASPTPMNMDCTATFTAPTLTVQVSGNGSVTSNPGPIDCTSSGGTCSGQFGSTTQGPPQVTLVAVPTVGTVFLGWSGDCAAGGTALSFVIQLSANMDCVASFGQPPIITSYWIGQFTNDPPNGQTVDFDMCLAQQGLTLLPSTVFSILSWFDFSYAPNGTINLSGSVSSNSLPSSISINLTLGGVTYYTITGTTSGTVISGRFSNGNMGANLQATYSGASCHYLFSDYPFY